MTITRKSKLSQIKAKLENAQKRGLIEGAKIIAEASTEMAPIKTGRLKRSIKQGMPKNEASGVISITVGTNVEYAYFQEFGTKKMSANPYLRPAIKKHKSDVVKAIVSNIEAALK